MSLTEAVVGLFEAQRYFILALNETNIDTDQRRLLYEISKMNHRLAKVLDLDVTSMSDLEKRNKEVMMLEKLYNTQGPDANEETTTEREQA